jgi:hypothetical protein
MRFAMKTTSSEKRGIHEMFGFEREMRTDNQEGQILSVVICWSTYPGERIEPIRYQNYIPIEAYAEQFILTYAKVHGNQLWEIMILQLGECLLKDYPKMESISIDVKVTSDYRTPSRTASLFLPR